MKGKTHCSRVDDLDGVTKGQPDASLIDLLTDITPTRCIKNAGSIHND